MPFQLQIDHESKEAPYRQLRSAIQAAIRSGQMEPGERLPPIRAICQETGLAYGTVSKATRRLVAEGLLEARTGSGTRVAARRPKTGCLGIVSQRTLAEVTASSPYFLRAYVGCQDEIVNAGYTQMFERYQPDKPLSDLFDEMRQVDGVIFFNSAGTQAQELDRLATLGVPTVAVGGGSAPSQVPVVRTDNAADSRSAVCRLVELGHRRIAFSTTAETGLAASLRRAGYEAALRQNGLEIDPQLCLTATGRELGEQLAALEPPPTALFMAGGIYEIEETLPVLLEAGLDPRRDVLIAAYDVPPHSALSELGAPYIAIHQPVEELGRCAVQALLRLIANETLDDLTLITRATLHTINLLPKESM